MNSATANSNPSACGFSVENPFCFRSAEEEFAFVDALRSPAGTRFIQGVKWVCRNKVGDLVDNFCGHYLDEQGNKVDFSFYANRYCSRVHVVLPSGWTVYIPERLDIRKEPLAATPESVEYGRKLRLVNSEKEFDDLYDTVPVNSIQDFLTALADGYNNHDEKLTWLFGLFDLKQGDPKSAFLKLKSAASAGLPGAQLSLAKLFHSSKPLSLTEKMKNTMASMAGQYHKNNDSALYWVKQAVGQGYEPAERQLETWYLEGIIPGDKVELAASVYMSKASAGDPDAMLRVAEVYRGRLTYYGVIKKHDKFTKRDELAALWRKKAAEAGSVKAQKLMGDAFKYGWNVNADINEARHWYQVAADNGDKAALRSFIEIVEYGEQRGPAYYREISKEKDDERIANYLRYYKDAASCGIDVAARGLLFFIENGCAFPHTEDEVQEWKKLAKWQPKANGNC